MRRELENDSLPQAIKGLARAIIKIDNKLWARKISRPWKTPHLPRWVWRYCRVGRRLVVMALGCDWSSVPSWERVSMMDVTIDNCV